MIINPFKDTRFNILEIIKGHFKTLKAPNAKNMETKDIFVFFTLPITLSLGLYLCFGYPNEDTASMYSTIMTLLAGLLFNVLVLIISAVKTPDNHSDKENRKELLKETFYNISYTIFMALTSLVFLLLLKIHISDTAHNIYGMKFSCEAIYQGIVTVVVYSLFIHIFFTILTILYNIFKLFELDIEHMPTSSTKEDKKNK